MVWIYLICVLVFLRLVWMLKHRGEIGNLSQRRVYITGCDHGFGRQLAESLDKRGVQVYAGCLKSSSVSELQQKSSSLLKAFQVDVTKSEDVKKAKEIIEKDLDGRALWAIVNNAGIANRTFPVSWCKVEDFRKVLDVNLFGMIDTTISLFPLLKRGGEGRIVNVASMYGRFAPFAAPYVVSKFGVEGFSDGLNKEMEPFNISVHTLEPGFFKTGLMAPVIDEITKRWEQIDQEVQADFGNDFFQQTVDLLHQTDKHLCSTQLHHVVDAMTHALLAKHPKERYIIGHEAKFVIIPMSYLPVWLQIWIMKNFGAWAGMPLPTPARAVKKS